MNPASESQARQADLGVLFLHGIGEQTRSETLVNWLDPLVCWISASLLGAQPRTFQLPDGQPLCQVDTSTLRSAEPGTSPSHAYVNMVDPRHATSANLLVAEAFWADCFPPPSMDEVTRWLLVLAPNSLLLHFGLNVRRAYSTLQKSAGILQHAISAWRFAGAIVKLLLGCFVVLPVLLAALFLLLLIRLIPIPVLPEAILRKAQTALAFVIGDSMVFCASPTRLAAIVRETRGAMDWLEPRCRRMLIIAHSQGAAVLRHAITGTDSNLPPANLCGVVTLGAGLRKLGILQRIESMSGTGDRGDTLLHTMNPLFTRVLVLLGIIGLALQAAGIGFISWGLLAFFAVLTGVNNVLYSLLNFEVDHPAESWWQKVLAKSAVGTEWLDLFATHDPVSNGAIWDEGAVANATTQEILNRGSIIGDHTSYWQNKAEFLSRVAGFLSRTGKLAVHLHDLVKDDALRLAKECRQRRQRHVVMRLCWLAIAIPVLWVVLTQQDSTAVRCLGENARDNLTGSLRHWLHLDFAWLRTASATTVSRGFAAIFLALWAFACRWLHDAWDAAGAASLAAHEEFDLSQNAGFAWLAVVLTLFVYLYIAREFGLPLH